MPQEPRPGAKTAVTVTSHNNTNQRTGLHLFPVTHVDSLSQHRLKLRQCLLHCLGQPHKIIDCVEIRQPKPASSGAPLDLPCPAAPDMGSLQNADGLLHHISRAFRPSRLGKSR